MGWEAQWGGACSVKQSAVLHRTAQYSTNRTAHSVTAQCSSHILYVGDTWYERKPLVRSSPAVHAMGPHGATTDRTPPTLQPANQPTSQPNRRLSKTTTRRRLHRARAGVSARSSAAAVTAATAAGLSFTFELRRTTQHQSQTSARPAMPRRAAIDPRAPALHCARACLRLPARGRIYAVSQSPPVQCTMYLHAFLAGRQARALTTRRRARKDFLQIPYNGRILFKYVQAAARRKRPRPSGCP